MIIKTKAYPRAGLLGNPSDGYFGKTISIIIKNFSADVTLYQTPKLNIIPHLRDHSIFNSIDELVEDVNLNSYYGGIRLIKASIKVFSDYCRINSIDLDNKNFTIEYASNIPRQVGMAGSSAIITAVFRALISFYQVDIPKAILPNLILSVENDELGIGAGLQDRVIQTYEGCVYMDFNKKDTKRLGHGIYKELDPKILPSLFIAYRTDVAEISAVFHNKLRELFESGDKKITKAMDSFAGFADSGFKDLENKDSSKIGNLINANFDLRSKITNIDAKNMEMIQLARETGASSKFSGSGGAIIGTYNGEDMYKAIVKALSGKNISVFKPKIV